MKENKINCEHACKNTCEALEEAIKRENGLLQLYGNSLSDCNMPDIRSLMKQMITNKKKVIAELQQKLDEIKTRSDVIDDIDKSYDKEDR